MSRAVCEPQVRVLLPASLRDRVDELRGNSTVDRWVERAVQQRLGRIAKDPFDTRGLREALQVIRAAASLSDAQAANALILHIASVESKPVTQVVAETRETELPSGWPGADAA